MRTKEDRAAIVYTKTKRLADRNGVIQGISGIFGTGTNWLVDVAALPFYVDLWNDIRDLYGKGRITTEAVGDYLRPNIGFLVQDFVFDKLLGSIPLVGVPFNYVCAKALTWRLGAWFGVLSALGEESNPGPQLTRSTLQLAREFFPVNRSLFDFEDPDKAKFVAFIAGLDGLTHAEAEKRSERALAALAGQ